MKNDNVPDAIVKTMVAPSSITDSFSCNFTSIKDTNLILIKSASVQVYKYSNESLCKMFDFPVFGSVIFAKPYRPFSTSKDFIFFLTEKLCAISVSFNQNADKVVTHFCENLKDNFGKRLPLPVLGVVDQTASIAVLNLYRSKLKIVSLLSTGRENFSTARFFDAIVDPSEIIDFDTLTDKKLPVLIVLFKKPKQQDPFHSFIKSYAIKMSTLSLEKNNNFPTIKTPSSASRIIAVKSPHNKFLIFFKGGINLYDGKGSILSFCSCSESPVKTVIRVKERNSFIFGDSDGILSVLTLKACRKEPNRANKAKIPKLSAEQKTVKRKESNASSVSEENNNYSAFVSFLAKFDEIAFLAELERNVYFVGSEGSDCRLVKFVKASGESGTSTVNINVLMVHENYGAVQSIFIEESESKETDEIYILSGANNVGTISKLENCYTLQNRCSVAFKGRVEIWADYGGRGPLSIFSSTLSNELEKHTFEGGNEPKLTQNGKMKLETVNIHRTDDGGLIHVSERTVSLLSDSDWKKSQSVWSAATTPDLQPKITHSSCSKNKLVAITSDNSLKFFEIRRKIEFKAEIRVDKNVSGVDLIALGEERALIALVFWETGEIKFYAEENGKLANFSAEKVGKMDVFGHKTVKFVRFGDSVLVCFVGTSFGNLFSMVIESKKKISQVAKHNLGRVPVVLSEIKRKESPLFLASSTRTMAFHLNESMSLTHSFVVTNDFALGQIKFLSTFREKNDAFPAFSPKPGADSADLVLFSSNSGDLHIAEISFAESPRFVALNRLKNFSPVALSKTKNCILVSGSSINGQTETGRRKSATFILIDKTGAKLRDTLFLSPKEYVSKEIVFVEQRQCFVAGIYDGCLKEKLCFDARGEIVVLKVGQAKRLHVVYSLKTNGPVWTLCLAENNLFVGLGSKISLFDLVDDALNDEVALSLVDSRDVKVLPTCIRSSGEFIIVGDFMYSLTVFRVEKGELVEIAQDYYPNSVVSAAFFGESFLTCDRFGNISLLSFEKMDWSLPPKLAVKSRFHFGTEVTCLQNAPKGKSVLFGSSKGGIGVVDVVPAGFEEKIFFLSELCCENFVAHGVGDYKKWRKLDQGFRIGRFVQKSLDRYVTSFADWDMIEKRWKVDRIEK